MDCPAGTVMSRLFRGRKILQGLLHDYAVEQGIIQPDAGAGGRRRRAGRHGGLPAAPRTGQGKGATSRDLRRRQRPRFRPTSIGELAGVDREVVERHLVGCPACARQVHLEGRFKAAVRAHLPRPEVPLALKLRVKEALGDAGDRAAPLALAVVPAAGPGRGGVPAHRRDHQHRPAVAVRSCSSRRSAATTPRCRWTSPARTAARSPPGSAAGSTFRCTPRRWAAARPARGAAW